MGSSCLKDLPAHPAEAPLPPHRILTPPLSPKAYEGESDRVLRLYLSTTPEIVQSLLQGLPYPPTVNGSYGTSGLYFTEKSNDNYTAVIDAFVLVGRSKVTSTPLSAATYDIVTKEYGCDSIKGISGEQGTVYVVYNWSQVLIIEIRVENMVLFTSDLEPVDIETAKIHLSKRFSCPILEKNLSLDLKNR